MRPSDTAHAWRGRLFAAIERRGFALTAIERWEGEPANGRLLRALCGQAVARGDNPEAMADRIVAVQRRGLS